jgi:hypothetical protein
VSGQEKTIDQFAGWEDQSQQHDFFGETNLDVDVVEVAAIDTVKTAEEIAAAEKKVADEKKAEDAVNDQFKEFEVTGKPAAKPAGEEDDDTPPSTSGVTTLTNKSTLEFLKEKGYVDYTLEEGAELTEEEAEELLEDSWEASVDSAVEDTIKDLPQRVKDLIKFATKGGNVEELLAKMANQVTSGINKNSDITKEKTQIAALEVDLRALGYDKEEIDSQIEYLKDSGKLAARGTKAFEKIVAQQEQEATTAVQQQAAVLASKKAKAREYKSSLTTHITSLKEIGGLPITKGDKETLPTYISDPTIELEDGRVISGLQADLFKVMADKDKIVLLAKVLKSDFNFGAIKRKEETVVARGYKAKIENAEKIKTSTSEGVHKPNKRAVWDMLD